jgi:hypothetical protein
MLLCKGSQTDTSNTYLLPVCNASPARTLDVTAQMSLFAVNTCGCHMCLGSSRRLARSHRRWRYHWRRLPVGSVTLTGVIGRDTRRRIPILITWRNLHVAVMRGVISMRRRVLGWVCSLRFSWVQRSLVRHALRRGHSPMIIVGWRRWRVRFQPTSIAGVLRIWGYIGFNKMR